jgi:hypothetical protein
VCAAGGIVEWNAVSKHATCGRPGSAACAAAIAASERGWCSGARLVNARSSRITSSSSVTALV